jgi:hypothetical protein
MHGAAYRASDADVHRHKALLRKGNDREEAQMRRPDRNIPGRQEVPVLQNKRGGIKMSELTMIILVILADMNIVQALQVRTLNMELDELWEARRKMHRDFVMANFQEKLKARNEQPAVQEGEQKCG